MSNPNPNKSGLRPAWTQETAPKGRKSAGLSVIEWTNELAQQELIEDQIRKIARDKKLSWAKRTAAERMLRTLEYGDIAEMQGLLEGDQSLSDLKASGVNTEVIKKIKTRSRTLPNNGGTEVEREIEVHDRAGQDYDRIIDRTVGKPKQEIAHHVDGSIRSTAEGENEAAALASRIAGLLKPSSC